MQTLNVHGISAPYSGNRAVELMGASFVTSLPQPCPVSSMLRNEGATQSHCDFHVKGSILCNVWWLTTAVTTLLTLLRLLCYQRMVTSLACTLIQDHRTDKDRNCALEYSRFHAHFLHCFTCHKVISVYHCMLGTCFTQAHPTMPCICPVIAMGRLCSLIPKLSSLRKAWIARPNKPGYEAATLSYVPKGVQTHHNFTSFSEPVHIPQTISAHRLSVVLYHGVRSAYFEYCDNQKITQTSH